MSFLWSGLLGRAFSQLKRASWTIMVRNSSLLILVTVESDHITNRTTSKTLNNKADITKKIVFFFLLVLFILVIKIQ